MTPKDVKEAIRSGKIMHVLTIAALGIYFQQEYTTGD